MTRFIQLHLITSYPPANLNRDDLGQPKTAVLGGVQRLRVSSQSLKRAWRTSELFQQQLAGTIGTRTKRLGSEAYEQLVAGGMKEKQADAWARQIAAVYGAVKKDETREIEQLVHVAPEERSTLDALVQLLIAEKRAPTDEELDSLLQGQTAIDIAMFGRMLAAKPERNTEAAVQVAHAIGVHGSAIEDDYFTAVDDLNKDDMGAGHVGEAGFGAAVFYQYICIDRALLKRNLGGSEARTQAALRALTEAAHRVGPNGKQNSFASRAYALFSLSEKGDQQPRSLSLAFVNPVADGGDAEGYAAEAVKRITMLNENMDTVYGPCAAERYEINVLSGQGKLAELLDFVAAE